MAKRRKRLTKGKARRIGKRRIIGNKSTPKQLSASKRNGKRAMRVARRKSSNRRRKNYGSYNDTMNYKNEVSMSSGILFTAGMFTIQQYFHYIKNNYYPSLVVSKILLFIFVITICIKFFIYKGKVSECYLEEEVEEYQDNK